MIESIYFDLRDDASRVSRYTLLIEKLAAVEKAHNAHVAMAERVRLLHLRRIAETRRALEVEGERLRALIKVAAA